eukprot:1364760-Ditylum_brightwellii.AAC.1
MVALLAERYNDCEAVAQVYKVEKNVIAVVVISIINNADSTHSVIQLWHALCVCEEDTLTDAEDSSAISREVGEAPLAFFAAVDVMDLSFQGNI